jgi:hypothetical protein
MAGWSPDVVLKIVQNPIYAADIDQSLFVRTSDKLPREEWIRANARLIDDVGPEQWLASLLEVKATTRGAKTAPPLASD